MDLSDALDLHPLYPSTAHVAVLLSSHSGLAPEQKKELVGHCLSRSCVFAEPAVLQYLLTDPNAQPYVDLSAADEDGLGLVSLTIHGFGSDSDRDVEREECARLLIGQGADLEADKGAANVNVFDYHQLTTFISGLDTPSSCCPTCSSFFDIVFDDSRVFTV
jgi:hypothetical protein